MPRESRNQLNHCVLVTLAMVLLLPVAGMAGQVEDHWSDQFGAATVGIPVNLDNSGFQESLTSVTSDGIDVYVGGHFTQIGGVSATNVARFDGCRWYPVGSALTDGVNFLEWYDGVLYATSQIEGPEFCAGELIYYDGSEWVQLGIGPNSVKAMTGLNGDLYFGGAFNLVGRCSPGVSAKHITRFDGTDYHTMGAGMEANVLALATYQGDVYAGGDFTTADGQPAAHVARWDGSQWHPLGLGTDGRVRALFAYNGELYVGGDFTMAGGVTLDRGSVAKWNGTTWASVGTGLGTSFEGVRSFQLFQGDLYAAGGFSTPSIYGSMARFDGVDWQPLPGDPDGTIYGTAVASDRLWAGGYFFSVDGIPADRFSSFDGAGWLQRPGGAQGTNAVVEAVEVVGNDVYAAGSFGQAGPVAANRVARWDGTAWHALSTGTAGVVYELESIGSDVYAGGFFFDMGGSPADFVARWDGSTWWPLGANVSGATYALAASGSDLYAGGSFVFAGGAPASRIARWDGANWYPLGGGVDGEVRDIAVSGGNVYAVGAFTNAAGAPANRVAVWDGLTWSPLGSGVNNVAYAVACDGINVYVGGVFTSAGGMPASRIARWNGSSWEALNLGANNTVRDIELVSGAVYVGGQFTAVDGMSTPGLARWNGATWSGFCRGIAGGLRSISAGADGIYIGGDFTQTGIALADNFGFLQESFVVAVPEKPEASGGELEQNYPNPFNPVTTIRYELQTPGRAQLRVYDVSGRLVRTLLDSNVTAGARHEVTWDGRSDGGERVASGVYFYKLSAPGFTQTRKMVLLK